MKKPPKKLGTMVVNNIMMADDFAPPQYASPDERQPVGIEIAARNAGFSWSEIDDWKANLFAADASLDERLSELIESVGDTGVTVTVSKEAPWHNGGSVNFGDSRVQPEPPKIDWKRGDMALVQMPYGDRTYEQLLVAADHPGQGSDECWMIVADENCWDNVGTFVAEEYLAENGAVRLYSPQGRAAEAGPVNAEAPVLLPPRSRLLFEAEQIITGDRNVSYGSPVENFQNTADIWTVQFGHLLKDGAEFTGSHVAQAMMGLKLARMVAQPKYDNFLDMAGYAACGWECQEDAQRTPESARRAVLMDGVS